VPLKETEPEKQRANIWDKGKDEMKKLIEYVKKLVLIDNLNEQNKNAV
jgi:hypothetical protein